MRRFSSSQPSVRASRAQQTCTWMNTEIALRHIGHDSPFLVSTSAQSPHANWCPQGIAMREPGGWGLCPASRRSGRLPRIWGSMYRLLLSTDVHRDMQDAWRPPIKRSTGGTFAGHSRNCTRDAASTSCSFAQRARLEALALLGEGDVELLRFLSVAAALRPGGLMCEPLFAPLHGHHVQDARTIRLVRACEARGGASWEWPCRVVRSGHAPTPAITTLYKPYPRSMSSVDVLPLLSLRLSSAAASKAFDVVGMLPWCLCLRARCWRLAQPTGDNYVRASRYAIAPFRRLSPEAATFTNLLFDACSRGRK